MNLPLPSCLLAALVVLLFSTPSDASPQPERITLKNGKATLESSVIRGERNVYILKAKEGQKLEVSIKSTEDNAVFAISQGDKALPGAGPDEDATAFKAALTKAGDYQISVGGTRGNASYVLHVSLE